MAKGGHGGHNLPGDRAFEFCGAWPNPKSWRRDERQAATLADHLDLGKSGWDKLVADAISFNSDLLESGVSRRSSEVSVSCRTLTPGKAALALFEEMVPRRQ